MVKLIGLYEELSFTDLEQVVVSLKMTETVSMDQLYEEFCASREEIQKAIKTEPVNSETDYHRRQHWTAMQAKLMPFRGRCPFRQYISSKPAKSVIKIWAACDAAASDAWNLQVYTGKADGGAPEKNQGMRVVLDVTQGLRELPTQLLSTRNRPINSSKFVFTADSSLVSYVPKKGKNVVLMSTLHRDGRICEQEHQKPEIIMNYKARKGGVNNLGKLVTGYSCKRRTLRWPLVIFLNILDISVYNAFVIWMAFNPDWKRGKLQRRRLFLEELGKALERPQIQRRQHIPRTSASAESEEDVGAPSA
ncbi:piggyBac transposable element-derived protein 4-like [Salvelinus alpinus]|uniref:piggyBac transposable element-derived protein 4-like n=1 Tax=Salvelinus alpinus TaxID=8036 RepID=UPI0039FB8C54